MAKVEEYEIINPSDKCFISGENDEIVCLAAVYLGEFKYGVKRVSDGNSDYPTLMPFASNEDVDEAWKKKFGRTFLECMRDKYYEEIIEVLKTFRYDGERSSINDIGGRAKMLAEKLSEAVKEEKEDKEK